MKFPKPEECPICFETMVNVDRPLRCGHWFHRACVERQLKRDSRCAICRKKIRFITVTKNDVVEALGVSSIANQLPDIDFGDNIDCDFLYESGYDSGDERRRQIEADEYENEAYFASEYG